MAVEEPSRWKSLLNLLTGEGPAPAPAKGKGKGKGKGKDDMSELFEMIKGKGFWDEFLETMKGKGKSKDDIQEMMEMMMMGKDVN